MTKRRGHGEGSIFQRQDGRWCAEISVGVVSGKIRRKTIYGKTRKEVAEKLKVALHDQQQGINIAVERITVAQFLELWLEQVVKPTNRSRTYDSYRNTVKKHLIPHLGTRQLTKLGAMHVQTMLNTLHAQGLTRTVPYTRAVLVIALNVAVKWGYVLRNVAMMVDTPTVERREIQPLTKEQALLILEAVKGHRLEVLYRVALSLGLRRGEVLGLRWEDIDFEQATMRISGALQRQQGRLERTATKTKSSNRLLYLPAVLVVALQAHRQRQDRERQHTTWQEHGLVFPSKLGTPLEPRSLNRHFASVVRRVGLPATTRLHDLRHSAATLMLLQGVPLKVISRILGHSQLSITADIYTHVLPELERDAAERIEALLGEKNANQENTEGERNGNQATQEGEIDEN